MGNNNRNNQNQNNNRKPQNNNHNNQQQKRMPMPKNPDPMSNGRLMAREGIKAIRDMVYGKYNVYNDGHVFRNPEFVKATISEIDKYLLTLDVHIKAIKMAYSGTTDTTVLSVLQRDMRSYDAYMISRNVLFSILETGDASLLYGLASLLQAYKYNI